MFAQTNSSSPHYYFNFSMAVKCIDWHTVGTKKFQPYCSDMAEVYIEKSHIQKCLFLISKSFNYTDHCDLDKD